MREENVYFKIFLFPLTTVYGIQKICIFVEIKIHDRSKRISLDVSLLCLFYFEGPPWSSRRNGEIDWFLV